jgi:hypothetical protein
MRMDRFDGIAILVNGNLITDVEALNEQLGDAGHLDATFIFIQAERTAGFDSSKISNFGFSVMDFFKDVPQLKRNEKISTFAGDGSDLYHPDYLHVRLSRHELVGQVASSKQCRAEGIRSISDPPAEL